MSYIQADTLWISADALGQTDGQQVSQNKSKNGHFWAQKIILFRY